MPSLGNRCISASFGVQELMVMDQGWCDGVIGFRIREGSSDGLALDSREVLLGIHFPGPTLFDGNATARVFIEEGADDDQQRELESIFQGEKGGPMEVLASLVSTARSYVIRRSLSASR